MIGLTMWTLNRIGLLLITAVTLGCDDSSTDEAPLADSMVELPDSSAPAPDGRIPDAMWVLDAMPAPDTAVDASPNPDSSFLPDHLGGERPALLLTPAAYDGSRPLPLVVLLGGYFNLGSDLDAWLGTREYLNDLDFILALPDGLIDSAGAPYWNATDTCCDSDGRGNDDVAYLSGLIEEAHTRLNVDRSRVILLGHSNGGFMGYRMACERPDLVSTLVSMAGSGWREPEQCAHPAPVSVLQVHGLLDEVMPFVGDETAPGALEIVSRWGRRNGCALDTWAEAPDRLELVDEDGIENETTVLSYHGCTQDTRLWQLEGSDHYPVFSWTYTEMMLEWALSHPRAAQGD